MNRQLIYAARKHLKKSNRQYGTDFTTIPREEWGEDGGLPALASRRVAVWRSRDFLVQSFLPECQEVLLLLGVNRTMILDDGRWADGITWDEMMQIKRSVGFGDVAAVEAFPPDRDVVNVANIRWLWLLVSRPAWMWRD